MYKIIVISWKELLTYFATPMAYVVALVFLAIGGYFFVNSVSGPLPEASIRGFLLSATFVLVIWSPVATMRLFAEEQKLGTLELLMTAPVRDYETALGKFVASFGILAATLAFSLYYVALLFVFGDPDIGPLFTGYLGLLLYGAATLSVGLFASTTTGNQIVSAVASFGVLLLLSLIDQATAYVSGFAGQVLQALSINAHFTDFARGVIDTGDLVYYLVFVAFFLFLTVVSLESRRWR